MPNRRFAWNERAGLYELAGNRGRFVSRREIRMALDRAIDHSASEMQQLTRQLMRREISLADWELRMIDEIRSATMAGAASAHGGFARMTSAAYGRAGAQLRAQYEFLHAWAQQIEQGTAPLDGRAVLRAGWYIQSARQFHERESARERTARGFDQVRSIRNAQDSCTSKGDTVGCVEQAAKGWQAPEDYTYPGARTCRSACKCFSLWRKSTTGEVAA